MGRQQLSAVAVEVAIGNRSEVITLCSRNECNVKYAVRLYAENLWHTKKFLCLN